MVGVPGRFKGCNTCRKRKIRCSLERPSCSQCVSTRRACLGYGRETIFVLNNNHYAARDQMQRKNGISPIEKAPDNRESSIDSPKIPTGDVTPTQKEISFEALPSTIPNSDSLVNLYNKSWRQQILTSLFQTNNNSMIQMYGQGRWTNTIPDPTAISKPLEFAGLTVALAKLGLKMGDNNYTQQSLKLYGQSLKHMQLALWDPQRMYSDELLGACMLLTEYEMIECPSQSRSGYLSHHNACGRLIQLRGPKAHTKRFAHMMFLKFRHWAVEAMLTMLNFLSQPEWKTVPYSLSSKADLDEFLDLVLDEIELMKKGRELSHVPTHTRLSAGITLMKKCWKLDDEMEQFYNRFKSSNPNPLFWPVLSSDSDRQVDSSDILASTHFEFCDIKSSMAQLYELLEEFSKHLYPSLTASSDKRELYEKLGVRDRGHTQNFVAMARKVCFSVTFGSKSEVGLGAIVGPLIMICQALRPWKRHAEELSWAEAKLHEIQSKTPRLLKYGI